MLDLPYLQKERKLLQNKRLDLDAAKTRLKKARMADARAVVSDDDDVREAGKKKTTTTNGSAAAHRNLPVIRKE